MPMNAISDRIKPFPPLTLNILVHTVKVIPVAEKAGPDAG